MCFLRVGDNICFGVGGYVWMVYKYKWIWRICVDVDIGVLVLVLFLKKKENIVKVRWLKESI